MSKKLSFFQSTIVRTVFVRFLLTIVPITFLCSACLDWGAGLLQDEVTHSYYSSTKIVSDSLSDNLITLQNAAAYLLDDECITLSGISASKPKAFYAGCKTAMTTGSSTGCKMFTRGCAFCMGSRSLSA